MSSDLEQLKVSLYDLSARNPFLNVKKEQLCFDLLDTKSLENLYKKAQFYRKEYGLASSLKITSFLKWKDPNRETFYISPLRVEAVKIKKLRKIETSFEIVSSEAAFINPILIYALEQHYDLSLNNIDTVELDLINQLSSAAVSIDDVDHLTENENWEIIRLEAWGNFNYKKSLLGQDFDQILLNPSSSVRDLLDVNECETKNNNALHPILEMDSSQRTALSKALNKNFVLQGPPGTGKSHSIVNLISSFVAADKKVLFVSQKKSALDVVYERLKKEGLGNVVAYFNAEKDEKRAYYKSLKDSWEHLQKSGATEFSVAESTFPVLDYYSNKLPDHFSLLKELALSGFKTEDLKYVGAVPDIGDWGNFFSPLDLLAAKIEKVAAGKLSLHDVLLIHKSIFSETKPALVLEKRVLEIRSALSDISQYYLNDLSLVGRKEFTQKCLAASVLGMVNKTQLDLLNGENKRFKSFSNWAKKYQLTAAKLKRQEQVNKKWVNKPSKSEITELMDLLKHQHAPRGIFGLLKRRSERVHHAFKGFDENLSNVGKLQLLEELRSEWNLKSELTEVEIKLKHNFNVLHPETEIDSILAIRNKLDQINVGAYTEILESDNSVELIQELSRLHPKIQQLNHLVKFTFELEQIGSFVEIEQHLLKLEQVQAILALIIEEMKAYYEADSLLRGFVKRNEVSVAKLNATAIYHHIINQNRFEQAFVKLTGDALLKEIKSKGSHQKKFLKASATNIEMKVESSLKAAELFMATAASKLKEDEKAQKKSYKAQKKLIIHEIAKKQQHLSVKEFSTECWELLSKIQKVWVMNPLAVSERLACEKELFDVVIFDEASQIPLEDAIPAIYRAKQIVVVGDDKQMPPSTFFSSNSGSLTLLDKASLSFSKEMFKWHYRSEHPALIQFSNKQFYDDELLTFPSNRADSPISFHLIDGLFKDGANLKETEAIAQYVSTKSDLTKIGIVAFLKRARENDSSITFKIED